VSIVKEKIVIKEKVMIQKMRVWRILQSKTKIKIMTQKMMMRRIQMKVMKKRVVIARMEVKRKVRIIHAYRYISKVRNMICRLQ
jgi:hypothetical protein